MQQRKPHLIYDFHAPEEIAWIATFGDYDFGDVCGRGATEGDAMADLLRQMTQSEWGDFPVEEDDE